jgi:excisionase family DNA binding protein
VATIERSPASATRPSASEYLTPQDVADLLQVDVSTVYRLASRERSMPVLRLGGSVRFPRERLERWLLVFEQGQPRGRQTASQKALQRKSA